MPASASRIRAGPAQAGRRERDELVRARRRPTPSRRASRGCSCRSPSAGARAGRRRRRSSCRLARSTKRVEVHAELARRRSCRAWTSAGTSVGSTVKPHGAGAVRSGSSGTGSVTRARPAGRRSARPAGRATVASHVRGGPAKRVGSECSRTRERRRPCTAAARHVTVRARPGVARVEPVDLRQRRRAARSAARASSRARRARATAPSGVTEPSSSAYATRRRCRRRPCARSRPGRRAPAARRTRRASARTV